MLEGQRDALIETIQNPYDRADENPWEATDEVAEEDKPVSSLGDKALDVAGHVVDVLEALPDVKHRQRRIAYFIARNKSPQAIAAMCGVSAAYVKNLKDDPNIRRLVEIFRGGEIYQLVEDMSAQEVLDLASVRAAEILAEKMNAALSEDVQLRAALEVLKLTGHGNKDVDGPIQINIGQDVIDAYKSARKEAGIEVLEAEIVEES